MAPQAEPAPASRTTSAAGDDADLGPPKEKCWPRFKRFAHNTEQGTYFGRDKHSWKQICAFYWIYYAVLTVIFAIMFSVMLSTIPDPIDGPDLNRELIDPAMISVPLDIGFAPNLPESFAPEIATIQANVFDRYPGRDFSSFGATCDGSDPNFGYDASTPCVFLRINRVYGFVPPVSGTATVTCSVVFNERPGEVSFDVAPSGFPVDQFPFVNGAPGQPTDPYEDPLVAVSIDLTGVTGDSGTTYRFKVGCQADWGQDTGDDYEGFREFDVDYTLP